MKKIILSALMLFSTATAFSQARKPIIMVIPSDIYCTRAGYVTTYQDESGKVEWDSEGDLGFRKGDFLIRQIGKRRTKAAAFRPGNMC